MKKIALILSLVLVASLALAGCQSGTSGAGDPVSDRENELDGNPSGYDPLPAGQKADGEEISEQDPEALEWNKIPMVMVGGKLYYDTGKESTISGRCGVMDGEITSTVDGSETPTKDNQSNFGTGFEYQYRADNAIEIFMNERWIVEQREGNGNQVRFGDRMIDEDGLSEETLEWLDWYNSLPEEQQLAVSAVPPDLLEESGIAKTEDAEVPAQEEELCVYPLAPE